MGLLSIPDLDQYGMQFRSFVTQNLESVSFGSTMVLSATPVESLGSFYWKIVPPEHRIYFDIK
jgi:hypothetical protein